MILFTKNTNIDIVDTKKVSSNNLYSQTFRTDTNDNNFYYQGEIRYEEDKPIWDGYGKMWSDYFTYHGNFKNGQPDGFGIYKYIGNLSLYDFPKEFVKYYKGEFKDGKKHGKGIEYYINGESYEGNFLNSLRNGEGIYYGSNGSEKIKGSWEQGYAINTTQITEFWENGNIKYKGGFNGNNWEGKGVLCYPNGNILFEGLFSKKGVSGKIFSNKNIMLIEGDFTSSTGDKIFYYENGEKFLEYKHPVLKHFFKNGVLSFEGEIYEFGLLDMKLEHLLDVKSDKINFYENAFKTKIPYKKGKLYYQDSSINNPKLQSIVEYDKTSSVLVGDFKEFYKNGILKKQVTYKNGFENGSYLEYFSNGNTFIEGTMENGHFIGSYREYNDDKFLVKSGNYISEGNSYILTNAKLFNNDKKRIFEGEINKNGKYIGSGKLYYDNEDNTIKFNGEFNNGNYHGQGTLYYPNGNLSYQGDWHNGRRHGQGTSFYEGTGTMEYLGTWVNEERHGNGTLFSETGEQVFSGNFHYNEIHFEGMEDN